MGDVRASDSFFPELVIRIETHGRLELSNVGRFFQRLDTASRRSIPTDVVRPRIEVVEVTTGSLILRLTVVGLVVTGVGVMFDAGSFAIAVADYLRNNPAAANSCRALIGGDNATGIRVEGGGQSIPIKLDELIEDQEVAARAVRRPSEEPSSSVAEYEVIRGPQSGFLHRLAGENWIELDDRPGLIIRIRDVRPSKDVILEPNLRYMIDGEAHIGRRSRESFFVLEKATLIR
jgi:hypothetical protein